MNEIKLKDVAPTKVVSLKKQTNYTELRDTAMDLFESHKDYVCGSLTCLSEHSSFQQDISLKICWPVRPVFLEETPDTEVFVLPRVKVTSVTYEGYYNELESAFDSLFAHIRENQWKPLSPSRIIYHKKEEVTGSFIFKKREYKYETEIQIPVEITTPEK